MKVRCGRLGVVCGRGADTHVCSADTLVGVPALYDDRVFLNGMIETTPLERVRSPHETSGFALRTGHSRTPASVS
jgi:hypothetical protein